MLLNYTPITNYLPFLQKYVTSRDNAGNSDVSLARLAPLAGLGEDTADTSD